MADKIVAMQGGVIQQIGSPLELYDDPANVFVAGFIGAPAMTFIDVDIAAADGAIALTRAGTRLVTLPPHRGAEPGGAAILGIRPEHVTLAGPAEGFPATVDYVEHTGLATIVHADVGGRAPARLRPRPAGRAAGRGDPPADRSGQGRAVRQAERAAPAARLTAPLRGLCYVSQPDTRLTAAFGVDLGRRDAFALARSSNVACTPVSSIFRHRNARASALTIALSTRGRGAHIGHVRFEENAADKAPFQICRSGNCAVS